MKLGVFLLFVAYVAAQNTSQRDVLEPASLTNQQPFKEKTRYTYDYTTTLQIPNPVNVQQNVAVRFQCNVNVRFQAQKWGIMKTRTARLTIGEPTFKLIETNLVEAEEPVEQIVNLIEELKSASNIIKSGLVFVQKNGVIVGIKMARNEPVWIQNMKRGIVQLFSVNFLGADKATGDTSMFTKTENILFGHCDCRYTLNDTTKIKANENRIISITKTIDVEDCRTPINVTMSTVIRKHKTMETATPVKTTVTNEINILRTAANWKLISVHSEGVIMVRLFGDMKKPLTTITKQSLVLIHEVSDDRKVQIPKSMKSLSKMHMQIQKIFDFFKPMSPKKLITFVKKELKTIHDLLTKNELTEDETTERIIRFVRMLRPYTRKFLVTIWDNCVIKEQPLMTATFMRLFAMIRTESSVATLRMKLPTTLPAWMSKDLVKEVLLIHTRPMQITQPMINDFKEICNRPFITDDMDLEITCLQTFVVMRKMFCEWESCPALPKTIAVRLSPVNLAKMTPENALRYIMIAETAAEPNLAHILFKIIEHREIPQVLRERCVLALRPLLTRMNQRITTRIVQLLRKPNMECALRVVMYHVLMEEPTPSTINAIMLRLNPTEECTFSRRYVYERLLALTTLNTIPTRTQHACRNALSFLHAKKMIPRSLGFLPTHLTKVFTPVSSGNIQLITKNDIHYFKKSSMPRHLLHNTEIEILGRRVNLLDIDLTITGVQELISRMMKVTPEESKIEPLELISTIKLFDEPITTIYKRIQNTDSSFLKWANLADQITKQLTMDDKRTMMPVEILMRLPTAAGIPVVFEINTLVTYRLKSALETESPGIFDLPRLAFSNNKDMTLKAALDFKSCMTIRGTVRVETPVVQAGLKHVRHIHTTMKTSTTLTVNPQTMKVNNDLKMPELPEVITTEGKTELFVHKRIGVKPFTRNIPSLLEHIFPRLEVIGKPAAEKEFQYKAVFKVGNRYITVDETTKEVILGEQETKWIVIPSSRNDTVIALCHPTLGCVVIGDNNELLFSKVKRSHFFVEKHTLGLRLKALMTVEFESVPNDLTMLQTPIMELVRMLRRERIAPEIVERGLAWKLVDPTKGLKIMHLKFVNNKALMSAVRDTRLWISKKVVETASQRIRCVAREFGTCLTKVSPVMPLCVYGVLPMEPRIDVDTLLMPTFLEVRIPDHVKSLKVEHTLKERSSEKELKKSTTKIVLTGSDKRFDMHIEFDNQNIIRSFKIEKFLKETSLGFMVCSELIPTEDSFKFTLSFDAKCKIEHFKIVPVRESKKVWPRLEMRFRWSLKLMNPRVPMPIRRLLVNLIRTTILPRLTTGIEQVPTQWRSTSLIHETNSFGMMTIYLPTTKLMTITLESQSLPKKVNFNIPLDRRIVSFPGVHGKTNMASFVNMASRVECRHTATSEFITFDDVIYKYVIPTESCEQTLVKTINEIQVTVQAKGPTKTLRFRMGKSILVEVIPENANVVPKVLINKNEQEIKEGETEVILSNGKTMIIRWSPIDFNLVVMVNELGIEMGMIRGMHIYLAMNPLHYQGKVQGMCGNMDFERANEFQTPELAVITNPKLFALTWIRPASSCTKNGCPLTRHIPSHKSGCVPTIALPTCMDKCTPTATVQVAGVPMECPGGVKIFQDFNIPTRCRCTC